MLHTNNRQWISRAGGMGGSEKIGIYLNFCRELSMKVLKAFVYILTQSLQFVPIEMIVSYILHTMYYIVR